MNQTGRASSHFDGELLVTDGTMETTLISPRRSVTPAGWDRASGYRRWPPDIRCLASSL